MNTPVQLGRYKILAPLGEGGYARVYRAELQGPMGFTKTVALKLIKPKAGGDDTKRVLEFIREARLGGLLRHPNIVDVYELGEEGGRFFIAMEYIEGWNFKELIRHRGPLPPAGVLQVGTAICRALEAAHSLTINNTVSPIVHRDLKPANLLIDRFGTVKVVDFGIAWIEGESVGDNRVCGTLPYIAPEQIKTGRVDGRADLFALGATLYELLTGKRLFKGSRQTLIQNRINVDAHLEDTAVWSPVHTACSPLRSVLMCCLRQSPDERYPSARHLREALLEIERSLASRFRLADWIIASKEDDWTRRTEDVSQFTDTHPSNLGPALNTFFGREDLLTQLTEFVSKPGLITLVGLGGMGKTRLSVELGTRSLAEFPGGVWCCDLVEARSKMGVLSAISESMGVILSRGDEATQSKQLGHAIAGRGRTMVILDNAEQVTSPVSDLLAMWMTIGNQATFLLTSRVAIGTQKETTVRVGALNSVEGEALFRDRSARPLEPDEPGLSELIQQLDGLPLAIELAARRTSLFTPQQLLERISERFRLLRQPGAWPVERHGTLRAVLNSTWEGLTSCEQETLAQCSVFRGGFRIEAAEQIVDLSDHPNAPWVVDILQLLIDKCLIVSRKVGRIPRLGMLVTVSEYATECLESMGPEYVQCCQRRHAAYYAQSGQAEFLDSLKKPNMATHREQFSSEVENYIIATQRAIAEDWETEAAGACLASLEVLMTRNQHLNVISLANQVLQLNISPQVRIRLYCFLGAALIGTGNLTKAQTLLEEGLKSACQVGNQRLQGLVMGRLGVLCRQMGNINEAKTHFTDALRIFREDEYRWHEGMVLTNLGNMYWNMGRMEDAMSHYQRALSIHRDVGNRKLEGVVIGNIGLLNAEAGRNDEALALYNDALSIHREMDDRIAVGQTLLYLGRLHKASKRLDEADVLFRQSRIMHQETGSRWFEGMALLNLTEVLILKDDPAVRSHAEAALAIGRELQISGFIGSCYGVLGLISAKEGKVAEARDQFQQAESLYLEKDNKKQLAYLLIRRCKAEHLMGQHEEAQAVLVQFRKLMGTLNEERFKRFSQHIESLEALLGTPETG